MLRVTLSVLPEDLMLATKAAQIFLKSGKENFLEVIMAKEYIHPHFNVLKKYDQYGPYIYVTRIK